jgi:hypothetical protein
LEDLDDVGKTTSETEQAMMAYLGADDDYLQSKSVKIKVYKLYIYVSCRMGFSHYGKNIIDS